MQSISERSMTLEPFGLLVELVRGEDTLRVTPASRITPEARAYILAHKEELREQLLGRDAFRPVSDISAGIVTALMLGQQLTDDDREAIEERAAIMEFDGGLPRMEAERLASQVNDCMTCRHWQGVQTFAESRYKALTATGVESKPKSIVMGTCRLRNRPWRCSNIADDPDYFRWHFIGQCGREAA